MNAARLKHLAAALVAALPLAGAAEELRFGSVAMDIPAQMHRRLKPLTDYLSTELGRPVVLQLSPNLPAAARAVASGEVHITYLTPVAYLRAQQDGEVRLVAKPLTDRKGSFRLMIVVREDSPIRTVADLAGKSFAFGDPAALLQRAVVVQAGMPLERLGASSYLGHYDNIARGIVSREFDAGILKDTTAFQWEKKGLRILHASPELPPYNIVVNGRIEEALYQKIRAAFLRLDPADAAQRAVIHALDPRYDGFAPVSDAEYDVVRELVRPFDKPRP